MRTPQKHAEIRELCSLAELKEAEALQVTVWGKGDKPDNTDIMLAIQHEGGLLAGAFVDGRMLGFLFAFPTSDARVQHSHRLAVHPDSQGMGLGGKLKWYQRDWCLEHSIDLVRWTYDPLRRVNANLNIAKLGASAGIYHEDYYGQMEGINAGVPSDRLVAEWHLNALNVQLRKSNAPAKSDQIDGQRVAIPFDFEALVKNSPKEALAERLQVRDKLISAFADGFRITDFDVAKSQYLLT
jgi:predicted GNAT superfamily acetyltransferase